MSRQPIHICFYSNKCEWSRAFITELSSTPYKGEFRFICADQSPTRQPLPSWLKKVPTLVISGEPNPRTDSEVMNWLYERKMKDGGAGGGGGTTGSQNGSGGGGGGGGGGGEPEPMVSEMGSMFGDSYSFVNQDTSAQGNGGSDSVGNFYGFSFLGGGGGGAANTPGAVGTREGSSFQMTDMNGKRSKKEELLDKQMESYMSARNQGMPQQIRRQ